MRRALRQLAAMIATVTAMPALAAPATISLTLPTLAQVSGLSDVTFNVNAAADAVNSQNDCVWSNTLTRTYSVTATGSGAGSAFTLAASSATVGYLVAWSGDSNAANATSLSPGVAAAFRSTALLPTCPAGATTYSTLKITIPVANLLTMTGGVAYTGSLTLLITPS